jgi:hypothetical protein
VKISKRNNDEYEGNKIKMMKGGEKGNENNQYWFELNFLLVHITAI